MRKNDCSADILVRLLRVDSEVDRNVNAFNELGGGDVLDKIYSLISGVKLGSVNLLIKSAHALRNFSHSLVLYLEAHGTC